MNNTLPVNPAGYDETKKIVAYINGYLGNVQVAIPVKADSPLAPMILQGQLPEQVERLVLNHVYIRLNNSDKKRVDVESVLAAFKSE